MALDYITRLGKFIRRLAWVLLCIEGMSLVIGGYFDARSRIRLRAFPITNISDLDELVAAIAYVFAICALLTLTLPIMFRWLFRRRVDDYSPRRVTILAASLAMFVLAMALSFAVY